MKPALISNRKLTLLRKLNRKKYRRLKYLFLAEGERAVRQIIKNGLVAIDELFFDESQQFWQQEPWKSLASAIHSSIILKRDFDSVSDTENPQGVIALCKMPEEAQPEILASQSGVMIAADAVQDPGNLGTMIRTASWFSVNGILSGKGTVDLFHPKVVRSTAGATGVIPYINGNLSELLTFLKNGIWQVILLDAGTSSKPLREVRKQDKMIIVIGNEAKGVDKSLYSPKRQKVWIDSAGKPFVESLNAGISAAITLFELA